MNPLRRTLLKSSAATGAMIAASAVGLLSVQNVLAAEWNKSAFEAKTAADAVNSLGAATAANSADLVIKAPDIAENGAVVPIDLISNIPNTESLSVLVDNNPLPLAGSFSFANGAVPMVGVRLKLAKSSTIKVVAKAGGKFYSASKEIKVTVGGCGG